MSIETSTDCKGLDDIYSTDLEKLNIEDLMVTHCRSTALESIHMLSRYLVNFQIVEILTCDKLLEQLSSIPVQGEIDE